MNAYQRSPQNADLIQNTRENPVKLQPLQCAEREPFQITGTGYGNLNY